MQLEQSSKVMHLIYGCFCFLCVKESQQSLRVPEHPLVYMICSVQVIAPCHCGSPSGEKEGTLYHDFKSREYF